MNHFDQTKIELEDKWLTVSLGAPHSVLSWAIIGGGISTQSSVVWHQINNADLPVSVDAVDFFQRKLNERAGLDRAVGFLTSASLNNYSHRVCARDKHQVRCLGTVGLSNGVRVGVVNPQLEKVGTINLLVQLSGGLSFPASLEAMSVAAEARTLAVLEARVSSGSGRDGSSWITGTGTDCIAIASAQGEAGDFYAGKHTIWGQLIGQTVFECVTDGIKKWKELKNGE
jgi:adenosylcobinamide amidohydrolase